MKIHIMCSEPYQQRPRTSVTPWNSTNSAVTSKLRCKIRSGKGAAECVNRSCKWGVTLGDIWQPRGAKRPEAGPTASLHTANSRKAIRKNKFVRTMTRAWEIPDTYANNVQLPLMYGVKLSTNPLNPWGILTQVPFTQLLKLQLSVKFAPVQKKALPEET